MIKNNTNSRFYKNFTPKIFVRYMHRLTWRTNSVVFYNHKVMLPKNILLPNNNNLKIIKPFCTQTAFLNEKEIIQNLPSQNTPGKMVVLTDLQKDALYCQKISQLVKSPKGIAHPILIKRLKNGKFIFLGRSATHSRRVGTHWTKALSSSIKRRNNYYHSTRLHILRKIDQQRIDDRFLNKHTVQTMAPDNSQLERVLHSAHGINVDPIIKPVNTPKDEE